MLSKLVQTQSHTRALLSKRRSLGPAVHCKRSPRAFGPILSIQN
eukprot:UN06646